MADLAFDIYPADEPRNGDLLVRLTKADFLKGTMYRSALRGTGEGMIVIHSEHAAVQAGHLSADNYIRVIDLGYDEIIGGFFLMEGEEKVLSRDEQGGEIRSYGGPGTLAYLARATFPHVLRSDVDESLGEHQAYVDATGFLRFTGPETYGGVLGREIYEARLDVPSAVPDLPAHSWDDVEDSGGTSWTSFDGDYDVQVGDNLLALALDLMKKGIDLMLDPHTFTPRAYLEGTFGTDRTSATFASGKVRFQAGVNIAADLDKALHRMTYVSHLLVVGSDNVTKGEYVDPDWSPGDPVYRDTLRLDNTIDVLIMEEAAAEYVRERKLRSDQATFPILSGGDPDNGYYAAGIHFVAGDYVTLHSGVGEHDYNEQAIQVAAIQWNEHDNGQFIPSVELGSQYVSAQGAAEIRQLSTLIGAHTHAPNPQLCTHVALPPIETSTVWKITASPTLLSAPVGWHTAAFDASAYANAAHSDDPSDTVYDHASTRWVWSADSDDHFIWLRRTFTLDAIPTNARILFASDGESTFYINGTEVGVGNGPLSSQLIAVDPDVFVVGTNVFAINTTDNDPDPFHAVYAVLNLIGDADPSLVGTSVQAARCDHTHLLDDLPTRSLDTTKRLAPDGAGGVEWVAMAEGMVAWFNVQNYGAVADGATDDLVACNAARAALVANGGGRLYFPASPDAYVLTAGLDAITVPCIVMGDGTGASVIECSSTTADILTAQSHNVVFRDMRIGSTAATPTAGAAIRVESGGNHGRFQNLIITGTWTGIRQEAGIVWTGDDVYIDSVRKYGWHISNAASPDGGDWSIGKTVISAIGHSPDAAIRIDSSGGGKIGLLKINGSDPSTGFNHGIDLAIAGTDQTSILEVAAYTIENVRGDAFHFTQAGTASFSQIVLGVGQVSLIGNNTGKVMSAVAEDAGGLKHIVLGPMTVATDGTARTPFQITNVDNITFVGVEQAENFAGQPLYTNSGSTNITVVGELNAAADVSITDAGGYFTGTDVEAALQELGAAAGASSGHYELLMVGASPPEPLENGTGTDWLYVFVPD